MEQRAKRLEGSPHRPSAGFPCAGSAGPARRLAALLAPLLLVAAGTGCQSPSPDPRPNLLLITLDTFRADHLGCAGNPAVRTPFLDRLERTGRHWPEAVTAIPLTTPSHATVLTGLSPRGHGLVRNRMRLDPAVPTLAGTLRDAGWRTAAVVSNRTVLDPELGLNHGFGTYDVVEPQRRPASGEGARTTAAARAALDALPAGAPWFAWIHYFDPHLPYVPPAPLDRLYDPGYSGDLSMDRYRVVQEQLHNGEDADPADVRHLAALYAGEITFVDRSVGQLLRATHDAHPIVLITADHGEGLYEHRHYFGHDILLHDPAVRVPMLLAGPLPGEPTPGPLRPEPAQTLDVTPTLLSLAGLEPSAALEGRDLVGEAPRRGTEGRMILETYPDEEKAAPSFGLRSPEGKIIWSAVDGVEAYDLVADPAERANLAASEPEPLPDLHAALMADLQHRPPGKALTIDDERGGLDAETRAALESLGYVDR